MTNTKQVLPGDTFHFLKTGMVYLTDESLTGATATSRRGQTLTLTQKLIDSNKNRNGDSFFTRIGDRAYQLQRFGHLVAAPGEAPADLTWWTPNSPEQTMAAESARLVAGAIADPAERQRALRDVAATFGVQSSQVSSALDGGLPGLDGGTR
jgi:hypothetical protein